MTVIIFLWRQMKRSLGRSLPIHHASATDTLCVVVQSLVESLSHRFKAQNAERSVKLGLLES